VRQDFESFFDRAVPEGSLTIAIATRAGRPARASQASLLGDLDIPVSNGQPRLGTWQASICAKPRPRRSRRIVVTVQGNELMSDTIKTLRLVMHGRVQACGTGLDAPRGRASGRQGWVATAATAREAMVQGEAAAVDELVRWAHRGRRWPRWSASRSNRARHYAASRCGFV